ncbi:serine/threonine-protein kinase PCRK1-like [Impatiens glandulifera]|uniref:serine/threonine-protein kinase PCRK1-like n=1 Tax=Impatiens glandulifera TaxID=253017 RepID=UPI001FB19744|nr:serine/threonine-protein kinase PCRK1-like [Impatiens glandulifera]
MICCPFYRGEKKDGNNPGPTISGPSTDSTLNDLDFKEFSSENVSLTSTDTESMVERNSNSSIFSHKPSDLRVFTFSELKTATKNFNGAYRIGEGGFGCVYKGTVRTSNDQDSNKKLVDVAVKQLGSRGLQGHKEWVNEVNFLGIVDHPNLVKLIGYCADDDERGIQRLLVYEYLANRSVDDNLSNKVVTPLPWGMRLKIARDAARGLAHLHEGMDFQIIFRDFKSSNILLDEEWNAKLSDFGLARLGPQEGCTHVSTGVVGTLGYAAPEYMQTGRLTSKSDVWGYGVFLYELITGRRPLDRSRPSSEQKLLVWIRPYVQDSKKFHKILDQRLDWKYSLKSAQKLANVANRCLNSQSKSRPKMSQVLKMVNEILEYSKGANNPQRMITCQEEETFKKAEGRSGNTEQGASWFARLRLFFNAKAG